MTYRELDYKATRLLDNGKITLGEYEEMTKPLDREVEQEPTAKENLAVAELGEDLRKTRTAICNKKVLIGFNLAIAVMNKHLGGKE